MPAAILTGSFLAANSDGYSVYVAENCPREPKLYYFAMMASYSRLTGLSGFLLSQE